MLWYSVAMIRKRLFIIFGCLITSSVSIGLFTYTQLRSNSNETIGRWFREPGSRPALTTYNDSTCHDAPFLLPSSGFIGLLYGDTAAPYTLWRRHTGLDIFGDGKPGEVPVVAVYDGHLTRLDDWLSTVIIRHDDPLQLGRTIWTYYTHMASQDGSQSYVDTAFPPGTRDVFVKRGTRLGYQGEYSGTGAPVGLHVHMSIVKSDTDGSFKNESLLSNTLDPSPYFGLELTMSAFSDRPIRCK